MYSLDSSQTPDGVVVLVETLKSLKKDGYLQCLPDDPGYGPKSTHHYLLVDDDIMCLKHGGVMRVGCSPEAIRKKLGKRAGKDLLSRAGVKATDLDKFDKELEHYAIAIAVIILGWWLMGLKSWADGRGEKTKISEPKEASADLL